MWNLPPINSEIVAAIAFMALWAQNRRHIYLAYWGVAQLALTGVAIIFEVETGPFVITAPAGAVIYSLSSGLFCGLLGAGTLYYRGARSIRRLYVALTVATITAVIATPFLLGHILVGRTFAAGLLAIVFSLCAYWLAPLGRFERFTALCFLMRAILVLVMLLQIHYGGPLPSDFAITTGSSFAIATAFLLLLTAFNRARLELNHHLQFLSLSHEITAALQGVTDEAQLGQRVIGIFIDRTQWDLGALLIADEDDQYFNQIAVVPRANAPAPIPIDGSLSGLALRSGQVQYSLDVAMDHRIYQMPNDAAGTGNISQISIPLSNHGNTLAVLLLRTQRRHQFSVQELQTFSSLGQVIGMSLVNARNVKMLTYRANHDTLTGLGNRAALHEYFLGLGSAPCTLMLFDLDHFKEINDALGHSVGDQLLRALADRLQTTLAAEHVRLFRLGGDEFVVTYRDTVSGEHNIERARTLSMLIAKPIYIADLCLRTFAAIGIAEAPLHGENSHELLRCADLAMYLAKQAGTVIAMYDETTDLQARDRLELLSRIDEALENDELELHYQPIIDLSSGQCTGCEALLRWQHPQRGLLSANVFMHAVEATDLIRPVTAKAIALAARDVAAWQQAGTPMKVSINLSARNILDPDLPELLQSNLREQRVSPEWFQLEITETILMRDPLTAAAVMQRLVAAGFTIALDDFGTGYSSLAYLARFPIHTLKIDQSFIRNMIAESQSRGIVESTVTLAHTLGLKITAEGVELAAEAELLKHFACDNVQGYFYARPMPLAAFNAWYRTHQGPQAALVT